MPRANRPATYRRADLIHLLVCSLLVLLLIAAGSVPIAAASSSRAVIVGGDRDYPPYEFLDRDGKPAGFNVDLTRAIAAVMGMTVEFRMGGWAEMRAALERGEVDILQGISFSADRTATLDFSPPHTIVHHAIFARRETPPVSSLDGLKGKEVVVFRGGIMHDLLTSRGLHDNLVLTSTPADALRLLASGRHDYAVVAHLPGIYLTRELKLTNVVPVATNIAAYPYGYAVRKGNAELLSRFTEGLAILKKTGQYQTIHEKWLGVLEPPKVSWLVLAKYGAIVVVPLVLVLGGTVLWSRSLSRQVAQRTESLKQEVAERERAVEELRKNQQQLVQADKMAALGTLVSGVAHEINNPNGLILLNIPILREVCEDAAETLEKRYREEGDFLLGGLPYSRMREQVPHLLDGISDGARRIKRIVDDLKDFARRDDVAMLVPVDLNEVARTAARLVEPTVRAATDRFETRFADALPLFAGSPQRIEQVVVNLLINASQALPDREKGIFVETSSDAAGTEVILTVRDEGVGISDEDLAHITDPFFTTRRDSGGTGLGLSVSAGIVKEHGGTLSFSSAPGAGTTVRLALPIRKPSTPEAS